MRKELLYGVLIGIALAIVISAGAVYFYFSSGAAPAAVSDPLMPFERKMANLALNAHIEKQHVGQPPIQPDEPNLVSGAQVYKENCASCHGLPDHPSKLVTMMFPRPTQLFKGKGVTDDPPSESYWKAANGIRLSGMPAFGKELTQTQLWQVSLLVAHANELPETAKKALLVPLPQASD